MAVKVAYGKKSSVNSAIANGTIPKNSIIITKDVLDAELLFYDSEGNLKTIAEKTRFETLDEAKQWAKDYPCSGLIFTVHDGNEWTLYKVNNDNTLSPIVANIIDTTNIRYIDGGTSGD